MGGQAVTEAQINAVNWLCQHGGDGMWDKTGVLIAAWLCSAFRNEGAGLSSDLIVQAVAATRALYGEPPALGMVTFVDVDKVRAKSDPGYCFLKAGFMHVGWTKGGLKALQLVPERMPPPDMPLGATPDMFGGAAA